MLVFAGPCGVLPAESMAREVEFLVQFKDEVDLVIRAGAYKGQLYPNKKMVDGKWVATEKEYVGMGDHGIIILGDIEKNLGIPTCTEVQNEMQGAYADVEGISWAQVGSRHMGNLPLLRWLRHRGGKILLKRGMGNTIHEWIGAAEHLRFESNNRVVLCERGIVTHEHTDPRIRWRPDVLAIPQIQADYPEFEIILDVSHSVGRRDLVLPMAKAALAAGADGIMVEVMENPAESKTDAQQTIDHREFAKLMCWIEEYKRSGL